MSPRRFPHALKTALIAMTSLSLLLASTGCSSESQQRAVATETTTLSAKDATTLLVADLSGELKITGHDGDDIKVLVKVSSIKNSSKDTEAREAAKAVASLDGTKATVETIKELPDGYGADVEISAPKNLTLTVNDTSGDLSINEWDGDVTIQDTSGDIILTKVKKYTIASDTSGDVSVDGQKVK